MKKLVICLFSFAVISCNNSSSGDSAAPTPRQDSVSANMNESHGDNRGERSVGSEAGGGTPGPGTITDTLKGKTDTADRTSKKEASRKAASKGK